VNPISHTIRLSPADLRLNVSPGTRLQDVLFAEGVEFPCGGRGRCKGCRVKVLRGELPVCDEEKNLLSSDELAAGWRLACRHAATGDLELELAQWEMPVLADQSSFRFTPRPGLGIAVDIGTTTLAAQLLDLPTGNVLATQTALNAQARCGADVMSRVDFAMHGGQKELEHLIRKQLGDIVAQLLRSHDAQSLTRIVIVGNTVMHHLFCGIDIAPLAVHPFQPKEAGRIQFKASDLGWVSAAMVEFLPCLGGFVGSDILAGIIATGLPEKREWTALMDLGTNGEVVIGNQERIICTSTAAGPAFEGARISMGMRAATGAIAGAQMQNGKLTCNVIGGGAARGLCGSGLVDVVSAGLELRFIQSNGRMPISSGMQLADGVVLLPADVRELQLAKGAIAAGLRILAHRIGVSLDDIKQLHLAGAFGNYVSRASAQRIGMLKLPLARVVSAGNSALLGAKQALFDDAALWDAVAQRVEHVALNEDESFQDIYAEEMRFPV